jgi:hypothetical protein
MKSTDGNWADGYGFYYRDNTGPLCGYVNNYFGRFACGTFATGATFHHVVLTYNGTLVTLYVDGAVAGTSAGAPAAITTNDAPLYIGAGQLRAWDGAIDEVRIFNRALSLPEVQNLFSDP